MLLIGVELKHLKILRKPSTLAVRALDALLDYQKYPVLAAELSTMKRDLGIGIINFAYWLNKHGTNYQEKNLELVDEWAEAWSYYPIKASADLAAEKRVLLKATKKQSMGMVLHQTSTKKK